MNANGSTAAYFTTGSDPLATSIKDNLVFCDQATCMDMLRAGTIGGFCTDEMVRACVGFRCSGYGFEGSVRAGGVVVRVKGLRGLYVRGAGFCT